MSNNKNKKLVRFDVLVHPFFDALYLGVHDVNQPDLKFMAGLWGKRIKAIAKNPKRLLILIPASTHGNVGKSTSREMREFEERFIKFAERKLGNRLIIYNSTHLNREKFVEKLNNAGYSTKNLKKAEGSIYGEAHGECVLDFKRDLKIFLNKEIRRDHWLSLRSRGPNGKKALGTYDISKTKTKKRGRKKHLKKQSRPFRKTRRK